MFKITNREIQGKVQVLKNVSNKQLPVKVSYAIAKNIDTINTEINFFEEQKLKLIEEYASKDEEGNIKIENNKYVFDENNENECNAKYNELLDIEVELNLRMINLTDIINSNTDFSAAELLELKFIIKE